MRIITLILAVILLNISDVAQDTLSGTAEQARLAYEQGDYSLAIDLYQSLIEAGVHNASLYLNLGNAYYQTNQLADAMLNYRRAYELQPRDSQINENLAFVRSNRVDILGEDSFWLERLESWTAQILTISELGWVVFTIWVSGFVLVIAWILRRVWRKKLQTAIICMIITNWIGLILLGARLYVSEKRPVAVVMALSTSVLSGPGEDYMPLYRLYAAAEIRLLEERDGWARFALPDGRQGWIEISAIEEV
jgi:tetratricopeptide (TPR) repeat protein